MKWVILAMFLSAFTPIYNKYDDEKKINDEFRNVEQNLQGKQHEIQITTPTLNEMQDGEVRIISTGTLQFLIWRAGQEIFAVEGSCITVVR